MIRRWLAAPEAQSWWGTTASAEAEITLAMASTAAVTRIIEHGGVPAGYAHAVETGLLAQAWPVPAGTWSVDHVVAPAAGNPTEFGAAALSVLTHEVFATTLAVACSGLVSIKHEARARAYERAGFRWRHVLHDLMCGPSWLMLKERPERSAR